MVEIQSQSKFNSQMVIFHWLDLLIDTNCQDKNYSTFPIKERDSNSTSDGNENKHIAQLSINQKKQTKLIKSLKMSQFLNSASSYWVQVCNNK